MNQSISDKIGQILDAGDDLLDSDQFIAAIKKYRSAYDLVPPPQRNYAMSTEVLTAIGDAYFQFGDYPSAFSPLQEAIYCPGGLGNPFIHLRLGQVQFQLGNFDYAADELTRAYMGDGETVFQDEDPVYFEFLKSRIQVE